MTEKEKDKEEILKKLLKNLLEERLSRLEKRNNEQQKDIKFEKDAYKKQELLVKKLCSVKIEPKKPKNNLEKGRGNGNRIRDKTPNILRADRRRNNSNKKISLRSMTPDATIRKKRPEKKEAIKTDLRTIKKGTTKNNNIPSYMMGTKSNANKNRRDNDKNNESNKRERAKTGKRAHTADIIKKKKSDTKKIKTNKIKNTIENNLKLVDLKIEDIKEHVPIEEKKEEKKEEPIIEIKKEKEPETKKSFNFDLLLDDKKIKVLSSFLDKETKYNFFSCNKKLIKYIKDYLTDSLITLELKNDISESSTIDDQINALKLRYKNDQFSEEPPIFTLSKGTVKAIELLNNGEYKKIFNNKELVPPLDSIIFVYRIFFIFLKDNEIKNIKDQHLFWIKASEYIINNSNGKVGDFFKDSIKNFDFSVKNIYEAKKIIYGQEDKLKPACFSKICGTTGLVIFLIKDTLEYCGLIQSFKKNIPSLCLRYLEYIAETKSKLQNYIDNISEWCNNA